MRNNNRDIVIHNLINRHSKKSDKINYPLKSLEKLHKKEKERKIISIIQRNERKIEHSGTWRHIIFGELSFMILIKKGEDEALRIKRFIEKLEYRELNYFNNDNYGFTNFDNAGC